MFQLSVITEGFNVSISNENENKTCCYITPVEETLTVYEDKNQHDCFL